ncbi:MAG: TrbC/VirB2 family protein [Halarcobacter ebronensis]|uniref:TrbC/VirB2 family protein n=1 Tax=Halarcobacter ebronensis TaxID=1462615 RepID=UPI003C780623
MLKLIVIIQLSLLSVFAAGKIDVTKTTGVLDSIAEVLTSKILVGFLTIVLIVVGYMYLFNKGNVAKEWLLGILVGAGIILSASGIAAVMT